MVNPTPSLSIGLGYGIQNVTHDVHDLKNKNLSQDGGWKTLTQSPRIDCTSLSPFLTFILPIFSQLFLSLLLDKTIGVRFTRLSLDMVC